MLAWICDADVRRGWPELRGRMAESWWRGWNVRGPSYATVLLPPLRFVFRHHRSNNKMRGCSDIFQSKVAPRVTASRIQPRSLQRPVIMQANDDALKHHVSPSTMVRQPLPPLLRRKSRSCDVRQLGAGEVDLARLSA